MCVYVIGHTHITVLSNLMNHLPVRLLFFSTSKKIYIYIKKKIKISFQTGSSSKCMYTHITYIHMPLYKKKETKSKR